MFRVWNVPEHPEHPTTKTVEVQGGRERQPEAHRDLVRRFANLLRHGDSSAPHQRPGQAGSACVERPRVRSLHSQQSQSGAQSTRDVELGVPRAVVQAIVGREFDPLAPKETTTVGPRPPLRSSEVGYFRRLRR